LSLFPKLFILLFVAAFLAPLFALLIEGGQAFFSDALSVSPEILSVYAQNSLALLLGSVSGAVVFGGMSAYLCARFEFPGRKILQWLSILPLGVPSYLVAYTWVDFLVDSGVPGGSLRNLPVTCFIFALSLSPYVFLPVYAALLSISGSLVESARLLGRSRASVLLQIEIPLVRPAIFAGALLASMEVLADFGTVDFMAIDTWSTGIYRSWFGYGDRARAALLALVLLGFSGVLLFWESRVRRRGSLARTGRNTSDIPRAKLGFAKSSPLIFIALVPALFSCVVPLMILVQRSLISLDAEQWLSVLHPTWMTLLLALGSSVLVVCFGFLFAFVLQLGTGRIWNALVRVATLGYALPGGVVGIGLLIFLAPFSLSGSLVGLVFAYCIRFVTLGAATIEAGWLAVPRVFEEQARILGCSRWGVMRRVSIPLLRKSIACAFILACIDVIKELPASMLLRPFNFETLAIRTYNLASDERLAETAPASLLMIVLCVAGVFLAQALGAFGISEHEKAGKKYVE
jgi:iron(III) transport system permease protein